MLTFFSLLMRTSPDTNSISLIRCLCVCMLPQLHTNTQPKCYFNINFLNTLFPLTIKTNSPYTKKLTPVMCFTWVDMKSGYHRFVLSMITHITWWRKKMIEQKYAHKITVSIHFVMKVNRLNWQKNPPISHPLQYFLNLL